MKVIESFRGEYRFLSNFYPAVVEIGGERYPSSEHAYQAMKARDPKDRKLFRDPQLTAGQAKRLSRKLTKREDWHEIKLGVMRVVVYDKFTRNPDLRHALTDTYPAELIEGNTWGDVFWGVCRGVGENNLGKILMEVRRSILSG